MCVAVADVDGSGLPSVFVTNFDRKPNVLFLNRGKLRFSDRSMPSGLGGPSIPKLKFGAAFLDADLDGHADLVVANGHIHRAARQVLGVGYEQEAQFFVGNGKGKFREVSHLAGAYFQDPRVGRGVAVADFDNDGRPDVARNTVISPPGTVTGSSRGMRHRNAGNDQVARPSTPVPARDSESSLHPAPSNVGRE
jgi:hypothetical protein